MSGIVIIGGGIHGVHLAVRLIVEARIPAQQITLVDPHVSLLERWHTCTQNTGMLFLRSPGVHHLDVDPWSLHRFAGIVPGRGQPPMFTLPYDRPAVELFDAHCQWLIAQHGLNERHVQARAVALTLQPDQVRVILDRGEPLAAAQVLLAISASEQPDWPGWARSLAAAGGRVTHIFQPGFVLQPDTMPARVAVVGAGITGAQAALRLAAAGNTVSLISRHTIREHQFDSDPGWIGSRYMDGFSREPSMARRRQIILAARHRGSLPPDVHHELRAAIERGSVDWHQGEIQAASVEDSGITLSLAHRTTTVDTVLLATGFTRARPGGAFLDQLVETYHLPCAACGYPLVDGDLRWHPRIFVTGALAELELGPTARNITGARRAGDRIIAAMPIIA